MYLFRVMLPKAIWRMNVSHRYPHFVHKSDQKIVKAWVPLYFHAATCDFNLTLAVCLRWVASVLVLIPLLNTWLIMWKVKGEGGILIEYGWRQKELWVFGDHNYFLFFFFFFPCTAWKCCTDCPEMPTVCQCHPSRVDEGFILTDIYSLKIRYLKFHKTELNTGYKARHLRSTWNIRFCFLLILQLLYLLSLLYILMT